MPGAMDPILLSVLIVIASAVIWNYVHVRALNRRLTTLEKEHLALIAELEERLYAPSDTAERT